MYNRKKRYGRVHAPSIELGEASVKTAKRPLDYDLALPYEMRLYNQGARLQENVLMLQKFGICQD